MPLIKIMKHQHCFLLTENIFQNPKEKKSRTTPKIPKGPFRHKKGLFSTEIIQKTQKNELSAYLKLGNVV